MERERKIWCYWQATRTKFRIPIAGRFWLHFFAWQFCIEWNLWSKSCRLGIDVGESGDDYDLTFCACLPPVAFYFCVQIPWGHRLHKWLPAQSRECYVAIHNWTLWINPWSKWGEWNRRDPWYVRGLTFHIDDFLLGDRKHTVADIGQPQRIAIALDGHSYLGTATFKRRTWKRHRWFALVREECEIEMDAGHGLPRAGKGENSWDCGDDAVCGWGIEGPPTQATVDAAIAKGINTCLDYRKRYGEPSVYGPREIKPAGEELAAAQNGTGV